MLPREYSEQTVYDAAIERAGHILDTFDYVCVGFSGGKDSTVTLNIMIEAAKLEPSRAKHLPMKAFFLDEEGIPTETVDFATRTFHRDDVDMTWYCIPIKCRNGSSAKHPYWYPWDPEKKQMWCRDMPEWATTELEGMPLWPAESRPSSAESNTLMFPPRLGNVANVMGIRSQESYMRQTIVRKKVVDNYMSKDSNSRGNLSKCYPIYDWSAHDVWTAIKTKGWDYNAAYDLMMLMGDTAWQQRISPPFGEQSNGSLWQYSQTFPDLWERLSQRVPGANAAARWHTTELYGRSKEFTKPASMPWPKYIAAMTEPHDETTRKLVLKRIRDEIDLHYRKTNDPVLHEAAHPISGLSWKFLRHIAVSGDLKGRRQVTNQLELEPGGAPSQRSWDRYKTELAEAREQFDPAMFGHPRAMPKTDDLVDSYTEERMRNVGKH